MYVCVCNAYRDVEIRGAAEAGARCVRDAYRELGRAPRCGRCLDLAQLLIDRVHGAAAPPPSWKPPTGKAA